jgi:hypothetical protein
MHWSWRFTELATTVTGFELIRLPCVGLHESYGLCTQGEHERRTTPANPQRCTFFSRIEEGGALDVS